MKFRYQVLLFILGVFIPTLLSAQSAEEWYDKGYDATDFNDKVRCFSKALEIDSTFAKAYMGRAHANGKLGHYNKAIPDYDKAVKYNPYYPKAYAYRAYSYEQMGEYKKAKADYERALEFNENFTFAKMCYEHLLEKMKGEN